MTPSVARISHLRGVCCSRLALLAMFGWLVGMMTEYATGVSFVEQIKLTLNNLAILDLD